VGGCWFVGGVGRFVPGPKFQGCEGGPITAVKLVLIEMQYFLTSTGECSC